MAGKQTIIGFNNTAIGGSAEIAFATINGKKAEAEPGTYRRGNAR
jgi:hypothetical protein